jgi:hypothetical protein
MILSRGFTSIGPKPWTKRAQLALHLALHLAGPDPECQGHGADEDFLAIGHRLTRDFGDMDHTSAVSPACL